MPHLQESATEEWRPVVGYEGLYEVSNLGRVKRVAGGQGATAESYRKASVDRQGMLQVGLYRANKVKQFPLCRIVAEAFLPIRPSPSHRIIFVNGDRSDCSAPNLNYHSKVCDIPQPWMVGEEEWREVVGFEGVYEVSNWGRVRRCRAGSGAVSGRIIKSNIQPNGYVHLTLYDAGRKLGAYMHRLVGDAFIGPCPDGMERNHRDGNKLNNSPGNLEYITHLENQRHASRTGLIRKGTRCSFAKLDELNVRVIKLNLKFESAYTVARWFNKPTSTICNIQRGTAWKHVLV